MATPLHELILEQRINLDLRASSPAGVLRELTDMLADHGDLQDADAFYRAVMVREEISSTALASGVALPHARTNLVHDIVVAAGRSRAGVHFGSTPHPVHLFFLIGTPTSMVGDYLLCLGALTRALRDDDLRAALMTAETPADFRVILLGISKPAES